VAMSHSLRWTASCKGYVESTAYHVALLNVVSRGGLVLVIDPYV
jgi:hypothetical protein